MDALEFLSERKRMCNCYKDCCDCPLEAAICTGSSTMPDEDYKRIIAIVEQWSKEHPIKTRCGRYRAGDGLHTKKMKVSGLPSKAKAIEAWNRRADNG